MATCFAAMRPTLLGAVYPWMGHYKSTHATHKQKTRLLLRGKANGIFNFPKYHRAAPFGAARQKWFSMADPTPPPRNKIVIIMEMH
ncbi:hypothetical protein AVEN_273671-1 [Araneus ventricosus]|uniref:Uncharacterized protein n=1 Tax=Araneus ventricosus TaxID=182803 RepID=A0A4Y2PLP6_ARAVE|nr:hypothetical protein AVEN_273671-1 [Araneus ventricosus]